MLIFNKIYIYIIYSYNYIIFKVIRKIYIYIFFKLMNCLNFLKINYKIFINIIILIFIFLKIDYYIAKYIIQ